MNESKIKISALGAIAQDAALEDVKALTGVARNLYADICAELVAHAKSATYKGYALDMSQVKNMLGETSLQLNKQGAVKDGKVSDVVIRTICYIIVAELVRDDARVHPKEHNPFSLKNPQDTTSFVVLLAPGDLRPAITIEEAEHFLEKLPQNWLWTEL